MAPRALLGAANLPWQPALLSYRLNRSPRRSWLSQFCWCLPSLRWRAGQGERGGVHNCGARVKDRANVRAGSRRRSPYLWAYVEGRCKRARRVKEVVSMLRWGGRNSVHVVLMLLTPRGGAYWAHPEEGLASFWPNRYTDAINAVNDGLRVRAGSRLSTLPCHHIAHAQAKSSWPCVEALSFRPVCYHLIKSVSAPAATCAGSRPFYIPAITRIRHPSIPQPHRMRGARAPQTSAPSSGPHERPVPRAGDRGGGPLREHAGLRLHLVQHHVRPAHARHGHRWHAPDAARHAGAGVGPQQAAPVPCTLEACCRLHALQATLDAHPRRACCKQAGVCRPRR